MAPVIALTHALWDGWMPVATLAKCVKTAQIEQRDSARTLATVKRPFSAVVATVKRMQRMIFQNDPFLWCMHHNRIVDPRRVCPHSMHILPKKAARAWQWRRDALHEGYEGLDCGAVVAPLLAALYGPRLSAPEQAFLRSVVVDGQWTQLRKHLDDQSTLAMCTVRQGRKQLFRCSEVPDGEPSDVLGPFHSAAQFCRLWEHESFASRALLPALIGRPPGYTVLSAKPVGRVTAACSQEWSTAMANLSKGTTQTCAWQAGGWWQTRVPGSPYPSLERCFSSSRMSMEQSSRLLHRARAGAARLGQQLC